MVQEIKLLKVRPGQRITTFGDNADTVNVIISGRVAISHPNELYMQIMKELGLKGFKERA